MHWHLFLHVQFKMTNVDDGYHIRWWDDSCCFEIEVYLSRHGCRCGVNRAVWRNLCEQCSDCLMSVATGSVHSGRLVGVQCTHGRITLRRAERAATSTISTCVEETSLGAIQTPYLRCSHVPCVHIWQHYKDGVHERVRVCTCPRCTPSEHALCTTRQQLDASVAHHGLSWPLWHITVTSFASGQTGEKSHRNHTPRHRVLSESEIVVWCRQLKRKS